MSNAMHKPSLVRYDVKIVFYDHSIDHWAQSSKRCTVVKYHARVALTAKIALSRCDVWLKKLPSVYYFWGLEIILWDFHLVPELLKTYSNIL